GGVDVAGGTKLYPVTAAALMTIGYLMFGGVARVRWDDLSEAVPAFLTVVTMPLALSIADGLAAGFVSYVLLKLASGRSREVRPLVHVFAALFVVRFALR
ncbi:MAG: NCS2 family permease, partial [Gemmatimonadetes bacterium]|nr:NCS2 family permease [Gemmatimonadota bacterium]